MSSVANVNRVAEIATLDEVLAYSNEDVIYKFLEYWDVSFEEASDYFQEMKKWLWLSADSIAHESEGEQRRELGITFSMTLLDEMWHTFILFTMEYRQFCKQYFGFYLNHAPTTKAQKDQAKIDFENDAEAMIAKAEAENAIQFSYIYDKLGAETLSKWYSDWTDKITVEYLSSIRKNPW